MRKKIYIFIIILILIAIFGYATYLRKYLEKKYEQAMDFYNQNQYESAYNIFFELGDYLDSEEYLKLSDYGKKYDEALKLIGNNDYDNAIKILNEIVDYRDSNYLYTECVYNKAIQLFSDAKYKDAEELFTSLENYKDSNSYATKCKANLLESDKSEVYQFAVKEMNNGNYIDAIEYFNKILDYKDSEDLKDQCNYCIARINLATPIYPGIRHSLAVTNEGKVVIASNEINTGLDFSNWENIVSISGLGNIVLGLTNDGFVYSSVSKDYTGYPFDTSTWRNIIQIATGDQFAVALQGNGKLIGFGRNNEGQLNFDDWNNITQIAATHRLTVGYDKNENLYFAGLYQDELSLEYSKNKTDWNNVKKIYVSGGFRLGDEIHVIGLKNDGTLVEISSNQENLIPENNSKNIRLIAVGDNHIITISYDNQISIYGDPGTIDYETQDKKEKISSWPAKELVFIIASYDLTLSLTNSGEVYAAGNDKQGQLLANSWSSILIPKQVD